MSDVPREMVEERAYAIWREAGCPEGSSLQHWLQAEQELGVLSAGGDDPIVTLHELAVQASEADGPLARSVEEAGRERMPRPGSSTLQGGEATL